MLKAKRKKVKPQGGLGFFRFELRPWSVYVSVIVLSPDQMEHHIEEEVRKRYKTDSRFRCVVPPDFLKVDMPRIAEVDRSSAFIQYMMNRDKIRSMLVVYRSDTRVDIVAHEATHALIAMQTYGFLTIDNVSSETCACIVEEITQFTTQGMVDLGFPPALCVGRGRGPKPFKKGGSFYV